MLVDAGICSSWARRAADSASDGWPAIPRNYSEPQQRFGRRHQPQPRRLGSPSSAESCWSGSPCRSQRRRCPGRVLTVAAKGSVTPLDRERPVVALQRGLPRNGAGSVDMHPLDPPNAPVRNAARRGGGREALVADGRRAPTNRELTTAPVLLMSAIGGHALHASETPARDRSDVDEAVGSPTAPIVQATFTRLSEPPPHPRPQAR